MLTITLLILLKKENEEKETETHSYFFEKGLSDKPFKASLIHPLLSFIILDLTAILTQELSKIFIYTKRLSKCWFHIINCIGKPIYKTFKIDRKYCYAIL